jgi:hypothetical protein
VLVHNWAVFYASVMNESRANGHIEQADCNRIDRSQLVLFSCSFGYL